MSETIENIGEEELLKRLRKFMAIGQIDDDTADITPSTNKLIINTDLLVDEVHFSDLTTSAEDVGWKAIASNVSDLVASGSHNIMSFTVGLVVPPQTSWTWVEGLYQGITKALNYFGGNLVGGDCSKGKQKMLSITAIGGINEIRLHRSNAVPGDYLVTSGSHGLSRLGLAILTTDPYLKHTKLSDNLIKKALKAHQRPMPPLKALKTLIASKPKDCSWRASGTDSSDGLLNAVQNICKSSGCEAILRKKDMPKDIDWPTGKVWNNWCLNGGEDYEFIISLPKTWAEEFIKRDKNAKIIGLIKSGKPQIKWDDNELININSGVFKHF